MAKRVVDFLKNDDIVFVSNAQRSLFKGSFFFVSDRKEYSFEGVKQSKTEILFRALKLDKNILTYHKYTSSEKKRLNLAYALLSDKKIIVLDHFFRSFTRREIIYYMRFLREIVYRKKARFILLEDDMNIIVEYSKKFYLFYNNEFHLFDNYYDDIIYEYLEMPETIKCIKYIEKMGHKIDHEVTFDETLKAIYRSVV